MNRKKRKGKQVRKLSSATAEYVMPITVIFEKIKNEGKQTNFRTL